MLIRPTARTAPPPDFDGKPTHDAITHAYGPNRALFVKADMSSASDVEALVQTCVQHYSRLDIIVNNAGIGIEATHDRPLRIHETPEANFDATMRVNGKGVWLGCKYACAQMLAQEPNPAFGGDRGWIINMSSIFGLVGGRGTSCYAASKGAVVQITRSVALEYAKDRMYDGFLLLVLPFYSSILAFSSRCLISIFLRCYSHVNAINPGFADTPMNAKFFASADITMYLENLHPWGRLGTPEDVARVAVFLASGDASWVTGICCPVDGGYTAQ